MAQIGVTSGTKRNYEYYTDRDGNWIDDFDLSVSDVRSCQATCSQHPGCVAYTYRNPVFMLAPPTSPPSIPAPILVTEAHCWLKAPAPPPITNSNENGGKKRLISGRWQSTPF